MQLTTAQVVDYHDAFTRLDGYARAVEVNGKSQIVLESYDLSPKVKYRAALNKNLLAPFRKAFEDARKSEQDKYNDFLDKIDPASDPKEVAQMIAREENAHNKKLADLAKETVEVSGLLTLPGVGIRIRARDPGIINLLTLLMTNFIDGEPEHGQDRPKPKDD